MSNVIPEALRISVQAAMKDVFDSFSRTVPLIFYKRAKEVVIMDRNYSSDWDQKINKNLKEAQPQEFNCVITFDERQPFENFLQGSDSNIRYKGIYNRIRVQMELDAYEYLQGTERFVFNGVQYNFDGSFRGLGPLKDFTHYEIVLQRVN